MISVSQGVVTFIVEFLLIYLVIFIFKTVIEFLLNLILSFFHKSSFTLFKHVLKVNAIFLFIITTILLLISRISGKSDPLAVVASAISFTNSQVLRTSVLFVFLLILITPIETQLLHKLSKNEISLKKAIAFSFISNFIILSFFFLNFLMTYNMILIEQQRSTQLPTFNFGHQV